MFVRPAAPTRPFSEPKLVDAFAAALDKALAPLRQELVAMHDTWRRLAESLAAPRPAASDSVTPQRLHAAVVAPSPHREILPPGGEAESCLVPQCAAPVLAKQLCETHYRIMRRALATGGHFDPAAQRPARARTASKPCRERGCQEAHYAKGFCRRHYMAVRSRIRAAERHGQPLPAAMHEEQEFEEPPLEETEVQEEETSPPFLLRGNGGGDRGLAVPLFQETTARPMSPKEALPTAEMVSRVVAQYRGGLDRVAEVLGRNKRTLMELLDRLDLVPYVTRVRKEERQRIEAAPLRERLDDLLFREKLLDDLGCLKEVDDRARFEVKMRCASLAKESDTVETVLQRLGEELKLDDGGMKRLVWRYDLRRHLRGLKLKQATPPARTRT